MSDIRQPSPPQTCAEPNYVLHKTVVMVGMMGAGKTAVGRALAARLDVPFLDSDAEIERAANMTIAEIFTRYGEDFFREKEAQVIDRLLHGAPSVLSTGGGAFLRAANRTAISRDGASIWLDADVDLLWSRVKSKNTRPLLRTDNPFETLRSLFEERVPVYALADLRAKADPAYSIEDMVDQVIAVLCADPTILEETPDA